MKKDTEAALKWIVNILQKHNIPFQIGGGFAARMYGVERELADIDIAIPTDKLNELLLEVKDYVTYDLKHYLDDKWDCIGMTINYEGQEIDFSGAQGKKIFDKNNKKWISFENDFSNNEYKEIYGLRIPLMPKEKLIEYKSILKRDIDLLDLEGLKNSMIKAIAFDYGGVVIVNDIDLFDEIAKYLNTTKEVFGKEYASLNHLFNTQNRTYEEVITLVTSKFNNSKEAIDFVLNLVKESHSKFYLNVELINIIKELKNKNYKVALLSNFSIYLKEKLKKDGIYDLFDEVVISSEVGYQKPQPKIFEILFGKLKVKPNEVIFIDDTPKSLEGADKIGYIPILYKDNESLKSELSNILSIKL